MAWVDIADDWIMNSFYSIKANQLPHQSRTVIRMPLTDDEILSEQSRRNMAGFFRGDKKYLAFALPDKEYEITPSLYFFNIDSYSGFVKLNQQIRENFDEFRVKANKGLPPINKEREMKIIFIRDYYDDGALWFSVKRINGKGNRFIFKYYPGQRPKPFFVSKNNNAITGIISMDNKKIQVNMNYPPQVLSYGLRKIVNMPTLMALEHGFTYDLIVLQEPVPVKTVRHTKSYIIVSSMIPNEILVRSIKELTIENTPLIKTTESQSISMTHNTDIDDTHERASLETPSVLAKSNDMNIYR